MTEQARDPEFQWYVVGRQMEFEGEQRANLLRLIAITLFYAVELINQHGFKIGFFEMPAVAHTSEHAHTLITSLSVMWVMLCMGIHWALRHRLFPPWLKYLSTGVDILFLSAVLMIADGPKSPMVAAFFPIVVLSGLRFHLPLIRFSTVASMIGYLAVNGYARWFTERELQIPRYQQIIILLAIALSGIVLGQAVRNVQRIAREYAQRTGNPAKENE